MADLAKSMNSHRKEAEIHKNGLRQMVAANGGPTSLALGGGFLPHLITLIDMGDAVLNASRPGFNTTESWQLPAAPISLLSTVLRRSNEELRASGIGTPLISLLRRVHRATVHFECGVVAEPVDEFTFDGFEMETPSSAAIRCAAEISLNALEHSFPFSSDINLALVEQLRSSIASLTQDGTNDVEVENEILVWACFTGAAVAREKRTWFLAKAGPVVMSLDQSQLHLFKIGATRFCAILQKLDGDEVAQYRPRIVTCT
ncbi:hypothetical protein BFJ63_vAg16373 [Fusarium oxysporum f. sp. narcissi]|uniref:Uncharacterized protein n=1 Tax=Fusarium oxysporum f. sp. narcissi TaxID=451672 RepID=A0A4Q2V7M3_FUSOX|nr:hypothetical protein BFJ63_vAg16373 [Fusarium oxysporum f. sp. narcissi]